LDARLIGDEIADDGFAAAGLIDHFLDGLLDLLIAQFAPLHGPAGAPDDRAKTQLLAQRQILGLYKTRERVAAVHQATQAVTRVGKLVRSRRQLPRHDREKIAG